MMSESEKITINLSVVDLGKIDLLVSEGFYSNRTDLIRTAIRNQLGQHKQVVEEAIVRRMFAIGVIAITRRHLEKKRAKGEKLAVKVVGLVVIDDSVTPELADAVIESVQVLGVLRANKAVKKVLADRIT